MQTELAEAKEALEKKQSQGTVDEATEHLNAAIEALQSQYVLMNIPYAAFYQAEVHNDVPVDAFTSATKNKTRTASLSGGSYHVNADGSDITGITFPVKVTEDMDLSKYTKVTDEDSVEITVTNRGQHPPQRIPEKMHCMRMQAMDITLTRFRLITKKHL